ncbi:MAG: DUF5060 domain-containing protein [Clostridiales bacterium]|nr:DUF5060 domain-containing protein [Clostridiales bacterium]
MRSIPRWEIFEESFFSSGEYENPFVDVDLEAEFSCGERKYTVDGFFDGDGIWRVRFSPPEEGEWKYTTHSNLQELDGKTGEFACVHPISRGPLTLNPQFPNWFFRGDGTPQLIVNDGWFPHTANGHELPFEDLEFQQPSQADFDRFFDILADHGVNMVVGMSELYARQKSITDTSFVWPWKIVDAEKNLIDKERFNLDFYRRWEHNLAHAKRRDLFYVFEVLYDDSLIRPREWNNHPYNVKNGGWLESDSDLGVDVCWRNLFDVNNPMSRKYLGRYIKYTMARLACFSNILWEIGAENANLAVLPERMLKGAFMPVEPIAEWYKYWARRIALNDPYGRLRTFGDTTYHPLMVREQGNDFVLTQDPRNYRRDDEYYYYLAMRDYGKLYWQFNRPMVIGEMTSSNNGNYERERRMYWIAATSGYIMGRSDRHFAPVTGDKLTEELKFSLGGVPVIYDQLGILRSFIEEKVSFWRMEPMHDRCACDRLCCCLGETDREYLIYLPFGGKLEIDVPESQVRVLNPVTGQVRESVCKAGRFRFEQPQGEDVVLHIKVLPPASDRT